MAVPVEREAVPPESRSWWRRLVEPLLAAAAEHPIQAATIAGAFTYAVIRVSLARFYGRFGVTPEEVGLGYADVLARTVFGLVFGYVVLLLAGVVVITGLVRFAGIGGDRAELRAAVLATKVAKAWLVVSVPVLLISLPFAAERLADDVVEGKSVRPFALEDYRGDISLGNPFGIRAEHVEVQTLDGHVPGALDGCDCTLVYLGRANGVAVLYDVDNERTLRLPDADLVLAREP